MPERNVFISYSHDSTNHKQWVSKFASDLLANGINVTLDQWDVSLGDDLVKFMEHSIKMSDRVLMICTEAYTRKANDGLGGVGYESMVVTGDMVKNLGTKKFIPIIRQNSKEIEVPVFLSTRNYCNFSNDSDYQIKLEELIREIHEAPLNKKPPLGPNPFIGQPEPVKASDVIKYTEKDNELIEKARNAIINNNMQEWRSVIRFIKKDYSKELVDWLSKYEKSVPENQTVLKPIILEAVSIFEPLIAISLVGLESGIESFSSHAALLDEILYLRNWRRSGYTVYVNVERSIAYIFQALHGATAFLINSIEQADSLANEIITVDEKRNFLRKMPYIVGYPESFGQSAKGGWDTLKELYEKWPWLSTIFASKDEYIVSLCTYYMYLSFLEFVDLLSFPVNELENTYYSLDIPAFSMVEQDYSRRAYRQLVRNKSYLYEKINKKEKSIEEIKKYWAFFRTQYLKWFGPNYRFHSSSDVFNNLPLDIYGIVERQ